MRNPVNSVSRAGGNTILQQCPDYTRALRGSELVDYIRETRSQGWATMPGDGKSSHRVAQGVCEPDSRRYQLITMCALWPLLLTYALREAMALFLPHAASESGVARRPITGRNIA
jgi:hypothetical protein